ncbi:hypothetical protein KXD40_000949 [Peronospora effusa]|nr:hypothetical protein KXD40_000949 [Peronospora effusa]
MPKLHIVNAHNLFEGLELNFVGVLPFYWLALDTSRLLGLTYHLSALTLGVTNLVAVVLLVLTCSRRFAKITVSNFNSFNNIYQQPKSFKASGDDKITRLKILHNSEPQQDRILGRHRIGTTYSGVGVWQNDSVEILANDQDKHTTPSYVAFTDTERVIGSKFSDPIGLSDTKQAVPGAVWHRNKPPIPM